MNKEINYPIKYAVLELKERDGYLNEYDNITKGFIPSKCYVIESDTIYNPDGSNKKTHIVVFPFQDLKGFKISLGNIGKANIPNFEEYEVKCPINMVTELFDNYENAKIVAEQKNEELKCKLLSKYTSSNSSRLSYENYKHRIENGLKICYMFEQLVQIATDNMEISEELTTDEENILKSIRK